MDVTQAKDRAAVAAGIGDKKRVLTKLRDLLDNAQGVPAEQVMLRTADLLGKSVGLYKDVQVQEQQRSVAEIEAEMEEMLDRLELSVH